MLPGRYKLRYYCCRRLMEGPEGYGGDEYRVYRLTVMLLEQIKRRLGIDYEVYYIDRFDMDTVVYREHFVARSRLLSKILDCSVASALKSRRGNVYLCDVVAIVDEGGGVVWFTRGWMRDYKLWERLAREVAERYGITGYWQHLGFLAAVLRDPDYLRGIISHVERVLRGRESSSSGMRSHEMLVFDVIRRVLAVRADTAVFVEMPLGVRLLAVAIRGSAEPSRYQLAVESTLLAAYPLRADIVALYSPEGIPPGIYPCTLGYRHAHDLAALYSSRFRSVHVDVLGMEDVLSLKLKGSAMEIVEVKTGRLTEKAIGQLLTYEALLSMEADTAAIYKTVALPKEMLRRSNPLLRIIAEELGIRILPL